jgi:DNA repair exonuclease SbcCD ATPase subunit
MTGEELQALRSMMREEIGVAIQASEQRTRLMMHEEIAASEQRTGERLDKIDARTAHIEEHTASMDKRLNGLETAQKEIHTVQKELRTDQRELHDETIRFHAGMTRELAQTRNSMARFFVRIRGNQREIISMLDDITVTINSLQADQRTLEIKVDETHRAFQRDADTFQKLIVDDVKMLGDSLDRFAHQFIERDRIIEERLTKHENSPIHEAHPRAQQPGDAA